jgi:hypothetical protein
MPLVVLNAIDHAAGMMKVQPDLRFLFEEVGVRQEVQGVLGHLGFGRMNRFAGLESSVEAVRTVLQTEFGLDPTVTLVARGDMCDLLAAWEAAKMQTKKEAELKVEANFNETSRPASTGETKAMLAAHEAVRGVLEHRLVPSRYLLGKKLEELMENQPEVERLVDITSKEDGDEDVLLPQLGKDGRIFVKKGAKKEVKVPKDPEELRLRYRLLTNAWMFAQSRHPNRNWLIDFDSERTYGQTRRWNQAGFHSDPSLRARDSKGGVRDGEAGLSDSGSRPAAGNEGSGAKDDALIAAIFVPLEEGQPKPGTEPTGSEGTGGSEAEKSKLRGFLPGAEAAAEEQSSEEGRQGW